METERQRQTGKERRGMQREIGTDKLKQKEVERQTTAQKQTEKGREDKQTDYCSKQTQPKYGYLSSKLTKSEEEEWREKETDRQRQTETKRDRDRQRQRHRET